MIVVSNTSPLTNLAAIGHFDLLGRLYGVVHIADGVWEELNFENKRWPGSLEVEQAEWIERHKVRDRALVEALRSDLDRGESETIALALELASDLVLMDEKEGRHTAQRLGVRTLGVVGVLLDAKTVGHVDAVRPLLEALRTKAGFYMSAGLVQHALTLAKEA